MPGKKCIEVTFPYEVVEKEARSRGLTTDEFLGCFQAVAEYDNFEGVLYRFVEIPERKRLGQVKEEVVGGKRQ